MSAKKTQINTRPLVEADFEQVVNIDANITNRRRPGFFQKRLAAALAEPKYFIYLGCESDGELKGFLMARLLEGEYGSEQPVAVLDVIGVEPEAQGQGFGKLLMDRFSEILVHKQVTEIQSQADWRNQDILRFFSAAGFKLAPRNILEREVCYMSTNQLMEEDSTKEEHAEVDYSDPQGDQVGSLVRDKIVCRSLQPDDLDAIVRIDRHLTGHERHAYYQRKINEAVEESGIRVSLVAELKGSIVGFIMARVDYGEFDRTEPVAVLDTIGVIPSFVNYHVGTALLAQLLGNLTTLRLESIRTEVDAEQTELSAFLLNNHFQPAQRLSFSYTIPKH